MKGLERRKNPGAPRWILQGLKYSAMIWLAIALVLFAIFGELLL